MVLLLLPKMAGSATVAAAKKGVTPVKDGAVAPSKRWLATALLKLLKGWWQWHFYRVLSTLSRC
jgi:hypothetical protein